MEEAGFAFGEAPRRPGNNRGLESDVKLPCRPSCQDPARILVETSAERDGKMPENASLRPGSRFKL